MGDQRGTALRAELELERRKKRGREKKARKKYGKRRGSGIEVDEEAGQNGVEAEIEKKNADGLVARDNTCQTNQEPW